ncbi:hypothetical protein GCM10022239_14550 [Leifsonia bigeumensis]|uniref:CcmD family protein n=1 Tax=Leifsonella bigeumensis TaxID=433643 RepID=A0ABP7FHG4_9MICO
MIHAAVAALAALLPGAAAFVTLLPGATEPTPSPAPDFDPNSVTPTWVGFAITFLVAVAAVLLIMDMVRRIRRTRYRAEIQERLEAETDVEADGESRP